MFASECNESSEKRSTQYCTRKISGRRRMNGGWEKNKEELKRAAEKVILVL